jgi:predicted nucleic acid-binding protein
MAFVVVYDACVLYPAPLRDLLIRIARKGLVRAKWTDAILDECFRSILANEPERKPESLARTRALMNLAVADCLVTGYQDLIESIKLPDPDDRHVVAAAVRCGAQVIVTANTKDFPRESLAGFELEAVHPDDFVLDCIDLSAAAVLAAVREQAETLKNPPMTASEVLERLQANGLAQSVAKLRELGGTGRALS